MVALGVGLAAGLAGWALTPLSFAAQGRLLRALPGLALRTEPRLVWRGALRALLPQLGVTTVIALLVDAPWIVALVALAFGAWRAARRTLTVDLLRVQRVVQHLERGQLEEGVRAAVAIVRSCARFGPRMELAHVAQGLAKTIDHFAGPAAALRVLEPLGGAAFVLDTLDWTLVLERVVLLVALGRCEDARSALRDCERRWPPPTDDLRETHDIMTSRIDAATGAHAKALACAAERTGVRWSLVRAHAHAAGGERSMARAALEDVRASEAGPAVLELVAARSGPAADIARGMLAGDDPYRS